VRRAAETCDHGDFRQKGIDCLGSVLEGRRLPGQILDVTPLSLGIEILGRALPLPGLPPLSL
jgi:hypothetical protein